VDVLFARSWANFSWVLESLSSDSARVFWGSLVWGRTEEFWNSKSEVSRLFFDLGMIHVLVLSGSQVGSFFQSQNFLLGLGLRLAGLSRTSLFARLGLGVCWLFLSLYVFATGASAPLVRAFIVLVISEAGLVRGMLLKIFVSFTAHVVLFPEQVASLSFVLSWSAFLLLVLMAELGISRLAGLCLMCFVSQLLVGFVQHSTGMSVVGWKGLFSNLLFVPVFEAVLFPLGSVLAGVVIALSTLGVNFTEEAWERRIFDCGLVLHEILAQVFLGALKGIRYI